MKISMALFLAVAMIWAVHPARAGEKVGKRVTFEDAGFSFSPIAKWEQNVLRKRAAEVDYSGMREIVSYQGRAIGRGGVRLLPSSRVYLLERADDLKTVQDRGRRFCPVVDEWSLTIDGRPAHAFEGETAQGFANLVVCLQGEGRGYLLQYSYDARDYKKNKNVFLKSAKSHRFLEWESPRRARPVVKPVEDSADSEKYAKPSARAQGERRRQEAIRNLPSGWHYHDTRHYRILSNADKKLVAELGKHLELIIKEYEKRFPPPDGKKFEEVFIVRLFKERTEFLGYGAPSMAAAYFSPSDEEIVGYDASAMDRNETFRTMYHECFHQYIYSFFGEMSAHRWFDEGWGDYFAGFRYQNGVLKEGPMLGRTEIIREAVRGGTHVPLKDLVRYTMQQYYDGETADLCYAEGWALVYFLNKTRKPEWRRILPTYLETLRETYAEEMAKQEGKKNRVVLEGGRVVRLKGASEIARQKAVDAAFDGIDFEELERAFVEFTKAVK